MPTLAPEDIARVHRTSLKTARLADDPRAAWLLGRVGLVDLLLRSASHYRRMYWVGADLRQEQNG